MNLLKFTLITLFVIGGIRAKAQAVYIDPTTTAALALYAHQISQKQEETITEQKALKRAQLWVGTKMEIVKNVQNKIYRGLSEVSGTVSNAMQVRNIYDDLTRIGHYTSQLGQFAAEHPEFTVFAQGTMETAYQDVITSSTEIQQLLQGGELNLATAGDRYILLERLGDKVSAIKINVLSILMKMQQAERMGFWNALNPFRQYINTDMDIIQNTMERWDYARS